MTWETQDLFAYLDIPLLPFVFSATLTMYYFHGLVNTVYPPESLHQAWNLRYRWLMAVLFLVSLAATIFFFLPFASDPWPFAIPALLSFLYTAPNLPFSIFRRLQQVAMGKTVYLSAIWTYVTTLLPLLLTHRELPEESWWFMGHRFFLVLSICILFDQRDHHSDAGKGVRSMATMAAPGTQRVIYFMSIVLSGIMALGVDASPVNPWLAAVLVMAGQYRWAQQPRHDAYYTIFLDGMMAFTALMHAFMVFLILN